ncbi:MAG TPA: cobalt ECF transporter T component CbiQ [Solirubrobacteraceae bacterium]|nr:cobalt ECF transporter T component CbiQ [Solirubrobacteraceae bacterium]
MSERPPTPGWLLRDEVALCPCGCVGRRRKADFVDKTIQGGARVLAEALGNEDVAARPGLLQGLDPRAKLLSLLALLLAAGLARHIAPLVALYATTLVLARASLVPVGWFVRRVWLFIPIFTGIVVLPATLSVITHGDIVVSLGNWFGHEVGITRQGLYAAGLIVSRVATSISLVVLLTITTPWARVLCALRALFVPRTLVLVIGMAHRYLFVLLDAVDDMYTARKARAVGLAGDVGGGRAFVAASAGALFGKAHALSEEVHHAMVARGFRGEARPLSPFRLRALDVAWIAGSLALAVVMIGGDRALGA